jgi:L-alanine-DL-glutamate epimerase-like enolase superfamily enzyme
LVHGKDLYHYLDLKETLDAQITDQSCARAALDMAIMDWVAKSLGVPLYRLWGINPLEMPYTSFSIGIDNPETIRQKVIEAEPYPILKIKVGTENDEKIISAVRRITDKPLRVDANEGWKSKEQAIKKIEWLTKQGVELVEQPLPTEMLDETAWLRERLEIPLIADEAVKTAQDIPGLRGIYDGINIKLMKSGGLVEAHKMILVARAFSLKVMLGCMIETSLAISAAAQLAPLADYADLDGNLLISNDPFSGAEVSDGKLKVADKPGLGVVGDF